MAGSRRDQNGTRGARKGRPAVGLALGGGGARGLAHIGVLEVLEKEDIPIGMIAGTSIGAVIGGMYALKPDAVALREKTISYLETDSFRSIGLEKFRKSDRYQQNFFESILLSLRRGLAFTHLLRRRSLFDGKVLRQILGDTVPERSFADLEIPLAISAVDLLQGEEVTITEGDLRSAILASISLPGFFPPVKSNGQLLADIGVLGAVPADLAAALGADVVVAVDVSPDFEPLSGEDDFTNGLQVLFRMESISSRTLRQTRLDDSDVVIRPEVGDIYWADFSKAEEVIEKGREAARRAVPKIRSAAGILSPRKSPRKRQPAKT